jgi:hypothetical protein
LTSLPDGRGRRGRSAATNHAPRRRRSSTNFRASLDYETDRRGRLARRYPRFSRLLDDPAMTRHPPRRVAEPAVALSRVFRSASLRRGQLSLACFLAGETAFLLALSIYAYDAGGATALGLVVMLATVPGAVAVPFASLAADRLPREAVMVAVAGARALLVAAAALSAAGQAPAEVVYCFAAAGSVLASSFRPAHAALVPLLARSTKELVAANVSTTTVEGAATLVGPAVAALALAFGGPASALALAAGLFAAAALALRGLDSGHAGGARADSLAVESLAGIRDLAQSAEARTLVALFGAQTLVRGALNVLLVVAALELLRTGESGVGLLNSALGAGGLVGGLATLALVGRRRLGRPLGAGLILWGLPIAVAGIWPDPLAALALLVVVGVGNSIVDVAGLTLLQRFWWPTGCSPASWVCSRASCSPRSASAPWPRPRAWRRSTSAAR